MAFAFFRLPDSTCRVVIKLIIRIIPMPTALINFRDFDAIMPILIHKGKRKFVLQANGNKFRRPAPCDTCIVAYKTNKGSKSAKVSLYAGCGYPDI
jgi:hypothetical protein